MNHAKSETAEGIRAKSHLEEAGESYFQHMGFALSFSLKMFKAGFCVLVHAVFPELFKKTGSDCIATLHDQMVVNRKNLKHMR